MDGYACYYQKQFFLLDQVPLSGTTTLFPPLLHQESVPAATHGRRSDSLRSIPDSPRSTALFRVVGLCLACLIQEHRRRCQKSLPILISIGRLIGPVIV
jgi:hypothetical protein